MRRLVSSAAALAADRAAEEAFSYPPLLLMEEAALRLQAELDARMAAGPVVYLAGGGNNGGDVLAMARHRWLSGRGDLSVVQVFEPRSASCRWQAERLAELGVPVFAWSSAESEHALEAAAVWVDGLWGAGLASPLRPRETEILRSLAARRGAFVAAIDVPSGLWHGWQEGDPVLAAACTLVPGPAKDFCFHPSARVHSGEIASVAVSFPRPAEASAWLLEESDLPVLLPRVRPDDHKGRRGHVALAGGSMGMTGALVLAARSAAAAGAGLVSLSTDEEVATAVAAQVPAFQVRSRASSLEQTRYDAWVAGPGWGRAADRAGWLEALWETGLPLVIDADALSAWGELNLTPRDAPVVLTPHPGEFLRLGAGAPTPDSAAALAAERGVVVVLKGAVTWVLAPDGRRSVWDGRNPALGTGGSGDCLAGVVGALLAAGLEGYDAARAAVVLHGAAGKELAQRDGWFTADRLPGALARKSAACRTAAGPL